MGALSECLMHVHGDCPLNAWLAGWRRRELSVLRVTPIRGLGFTLFWLSFVCWLSVVFFCLVWFFLGGGVFSLFLIDMTLAVD